MYEPLDLPTDYGPEDPDRIHAPARRVSTFGVLMIALMITGAGPSGLEPSIKAGGGLLALVSFTCAAIFYSYPQASVAAELGSMMPTQGGAVIWVTRGLGPRAGFIYGWGITATAMGDVGAGSTMFASILFAVIPGLKETWWTEPALRASVLVAACAVSVMNMHYLSRIVAPALVVVLAMVCVAFVIIAPEITWDAIAHRNEPATRNLGTLAAFAVWQFNGWLAVGTSAGEVTSATALRRGLFIAVAVFFAQCFLATVIELVESRGPEDMTDMFVLTAFHRVNPFLGHAFAVVLALTVGVAVIGAFCADSRLLWGVAVLGWAPPVFKRQLSDGAPSVASIVILVCALPFVFISFESIIVLFYTLAAGCQMLVPMAQLRLRIVMPDAPRTAAIPGGLTGSVIMAVMQITALAMVVIANLIHNTMIALLSTSVIVMAAAIAFSDAAFFVGFGETLTQGKDAAANTHRGEDTPLVEKDATLPVEEHLPPPGHLNDDTFWTLNRLGFMKALPVHQAPVPA